jgi:putative SOS response-associated peptidase YedK
MCGRFTITLEPVELQEAFPDIIFPSEMKPRYNVAPNQPVLVIANNASLRAEYFTWGLVPSWAKDPAIGSRLINARSETLAEKPSFRSAFKYRRCLILADGFFEWQVRPGGKSRQPHYIRLKSRQPFCFAGLWEHWQSPDGSEIKSTTIITTEPNNLIAAIHNRMPVILKPESFPAWLDPAPQSSEKLNGLLVPYPAEEMQAYPVQPVVNSPANDRVECIQPLSGTLWMA